MSDLINRQEAIDALYHVDEYNGRSVEVIRNLPSAQQTSDVVERKKGKWIDEPVYKQTMDGKTLDGFTYCSECKQLREYGYRSKFCPNCGAEMKGEDDG